MGAFFYMHNIILFDTEVREALYPFTLTKPICELRLGILTIYEKWQRLIPDGNLSYITSDYLEPLYPINIQESNLVIAGALIPTEKVRDLIFNLGENEALMCNGELVAACLSRTQFEKLLADEDMDDITGFEVDPDGVDMLGSVLEIASRSFAQISSDLKLLSEDASQTEIEYQGDHPVFVSDQANVERALIQAKDGPVYIGPGAHIMDGARLRGPVSVGKSSIVKSHAFLLKGACVGPHCEVGGEIKGSVIFGYSNKSHEGYLGDSVIGEWCNLGALTSNSNLRNTFSEINVYDYRKRSVVSSGKRKCGFFMGDYSRTAIGVQINSGTKIGISCHVFGQGVARIHIPSFTWGGIEQFEDYDIERAINAATIFRGFKENETEDNHIKILQYLHSHTAVERQQIRAT